MCLLRTRWNEGERGWANIKTLGAATLTNLAKNWMVQMKSIKEAPTEVIIPLKTDTPIVEKAVRTRSFRSALVACMKAWARCTTSVLDKRKDNDTRDVASRS